jgi:DNA-binding transcriptional MocR family regulator
MLDLDKQAGDYLYRQVIDLIVENIDSGTLRPGDRLPSLRRMSKNAGVSVPTVRQAYVELERQRKVESRPKSGFYVRNQLRNDIVRPSPGVAPDPGPLQCRSLMERVYEGIYNPELVPLGVANPTMARPAAKALNRAMKRMLGSTDEAVLSYATSHGALRLRRQIAWHYFDTLGARVDPESICITNGGQEGLLLALKAVTEPGDIVAVESPTYHGILELIDSLGLLAVDVSTCPEEGVMTQRLTEVLDRHDVKVCVFSTTLNNPLGVTMPDEDRRRLADILADRGIPLIEDDVYGELRFDGVRPTPVQFLERGVDVITVGSFSKTVAPGYRTGWVVSSARHDEILRLKRSFSITSGFVQQLTLADFMASGDYARHLYALRPVLKRNCERMSALVGQHFPAETRVSQPVGGSVLWLELPQDVSGERLFDDALGAGISINPGPIYTPCGCYENFIRLSFGHRWDKRTEDAVRWLGRRVGEMASA